MTPHKAHLKLTNRVKIKKKKNLPFGCDYLNLLAEKMIAKDVVVGYRNFIDNWKASSNIF